MASNNKSMKMVGYGLLVLLVVFVLFPGMFSGCGCGGVGSSFFTAAPCSQGGCDCNAGPFPTAKMGCSKCRWGYKPVSENSINDMCCTKEQCKRNECTNDDECQDWD